MSCRPVLTPWIIRTVSSWRTPGSALFGWPAAWSICRWCRATVVRAVAQCYPINDAPALDLVAVRRDRTALPVQLEPLGAAKVTEQARSLTRSEFFDLPARDFPIIRTSKPRFLATPWA